MCNSCHEQTVSFVQQIIFSHQAHDRTLQGPVVYVQGAAWPSAKVSARKEGTEKPALKQHPLCVPPTKMKTLHTVIVPSERLEPCYGIISQATCETFKHSMASSLLLNHICLNWSIIFNFNLYICIQSELFQLNDIAISFKNFLLS